MSHYTQCTLYSEFKLLHEESVVILQSFRDMYTDTSVIIHTVPHYSLSLRTPGPKTQKVQHCNTVSGRASKRAGNWSDPQTKIERDVGPLVFFSAA